MAKEYFGGSGPAVERAADVAESRADTVPVDCPPAIRAKIEARRKQELDDPDAEFFAAKEGERRHGSR